MSYARDLVVLVPCTDTFEGMKALLAPGSKFRHRCRLQDFRFNPTKTGPEADMVESDQGDGDVHRRADSLLRSFKTTHHHALVCIDQQFGGDQPAAQTYADVVRLMEHDGWERDRFEVIVFDPDSEVWFWQRGNPHVEAMFGWPKRADRRLHEVLEERGLWPAESPKPSDPKGATLAARRLCKTKWSAGKFAELAEQISDKGCQDDSYKLFKKTLVRWFGAKARGASA